MDAKDVWNFVEETKFRNHTKYYRVEDWRGGMEVLQAKYRYSFVVKFKIFHGDVSVESSVDDITKIVFGVPNFDSERYIQLYAGKRFITHIPQENLVSLKLERTYGVW